MRIGLDYRPAVSHAPGVGRYARELVRALVRLPDGPELRLLEVGRTPAAVPESALGLDGHGQRARRVSRPWPRRVVELAARLGWGADRLAGGVDLFHQVRTPRLPVGRAPWTTMLSELPPAGSAASDALGRDLAGAAGVFVASAAYAEEVPARWGVPAARVHRVPVGCDHWARELGEPPPRDDPPLVLMLGAPRPVRRPEAVLAAVEALAAGGRRCRLHVAGAGSDVVDAAGRVGGAFAERLRRSSLGPDVRWDLPGEDELPALVARASVLVHLNDDEGTPVTPLEAFAVGTSVVASRLSAFEEALGGLSTLLETPPTAAGHDADPAFVATLAEALDAALEGGGSAACEEARRALAARWTWRAAAERTVEAWCAVSAAGTGAGAGDDGAAGAHLAG